MKVSRHFVFVEQAVGGKTYRQKRILYNTESSNSMMVMCVSIDQSLYKASGAVLPSRTWWVEEA